MEPIFTILGLAGGGANVGGESKDHGFAPNPLPRFIGGALYVVLGGVNNSLWGPS